MGLAGSKPRQPKARGWSGLAGSKPRQPKARGWSGLTAKQVAEYKRPEVREARSRLTDFQGDCRKAMARLAQAPSSRTLVDARGRCAAAHAVRVVGPVPKSDPNEWCHGGVAGRTQIELEFERCLPLLHKATRKELESDPWGCMDSDMEQTVAENRYDTTGKQLAEMMMFRNSAFDDYTWGCDRAGVPAAAVKAAIKAGKQHAKTIRAPRRYKEPARRSTQTSRARKVPARKQTRGRRR